MTVYIVIDIGMFTRTIAGVFSDEMNALRLVARPDLPAGIGRRIIEAHKIEDQDG